jgi:nuclear protein localization family protein 4
MPIPPWQILSLDPWKKDGVKLIPFTSWLRKRDQGRGECRHTKQPGIFCQNCRPLTEEFYTAKKCDRHEAWPKGVCSYCKPDTIRIQRQEYRHVDHVVFENTAVIGSLIDSWRSNGCQRGGFLFGRYVPHKDIPLGITAVVEAVYEPPQRNTAAGMQLEPDENEAAVCAQAALLGLHMIGFAWTSIEVVGGKIIKSRDLDKTFLASSAEMMQAALFQNEHRSACSHSMTGWYGSKWVSVLITGTADNSIAPIVFQVSDQMAGMARDGIITTHAGGDPRLMQTVDNPAVYVPKVLYDDTNEYNRAVVKEATPTFPPIPFWVDVNFAAPVQPSPMLPTNVFPIENRPGLSQTPEALAKQLRLAKPVLEIFADFHFFLYLGKILDAPTIAMVATGIVKRDQGILKKALSVIQPLVPEPTPPRPSNTNNNNSAASKPTPATGAKTAPASGAIKPTGGTVRHPKEAEWLASIASMGFDDAAARRALNATKWVSVEQAIDFLLSGK